MINSALLRPYNFLVIVAVALVARFLFATALRSVGGSGGAKSYTANNPA